MSAGPAGGGGACSGADGDGDVDMGVEDGECGQDGECGSQGSPSGIEWGAVGALTQRTSSSESAGKLGSGERIKEGSSAHDKGNGSNTDHLEMPISALQRLLQQVRGYTL